jgi:pimeloyl-ACP methyl ester carboxylesterase
MASAWVTRARRALVTTAVVIAFLALAGATYQGVATALERREFPRPGRLLDVGGHQLHLYCVGEGSPTVVLEAPAFGMSAAWTRVQPPIGLLTRVCSYDRAGLGWSEAGDAAFDPGAVPGQLHTLLRGSSERGPFILVGLGMGAEFVRLFALMFPQDTAALVLAEDPVTSGPDSNNASTWLVNTSPWLARVGALRAARVLSSGADGLPGEGGGAMRAFLNRPDHLTRSAREIAAANRVVQGGSTLNPEPGLPVITVPDTRVRGLSRLASPSEADALTRAIAGVVRQVRKSS